MKKTRRYIWILLLTVGCGGSVFIPEGDPEAGRVAFEFMNCHSCHQVQGESFPEPTVDPPVPVVLGDSSNRLSRSYLAESIIAPSHRFAKPPRDPMADPRYSPPRRYSNIRSGELSRMEDFSNVMSVREWLDIVAYLEERQEQ